MIPPPGQPPALKPRPKNARIGPRPLLVVRRGRFATFLWGERRGRRVDLAITARPPLIHGVSTIMNTQEEVKAHTRRAEARERVRYAQACPFCGAVEGEAFRWHDCRRRTFRVVLGPCIQVVLSWILRWRCLRCGKRFTDYPPFRLAREAVRQGAGAGEVERVSGNRSVLPKDRPA